MPRRDLSKVMPDMESLKPGGIAYQPPYSMEYHLHGAGGVYTLLPSKYGWATLQGENSTWLVLSVDANPSIKFHSGKSISVGDCEIRDYGKGNTVLINQEDGFTWKIDYAKRTKTLALVSGRWVEAHWADLIGALSVLASQESMETIPLAYNGFSGAYVKAVNRIVQQVQDGVMLIGTRLEASNQQNGKLSTPTLVVNEAWVNAHASSMDALYRALETLANKYPHSSISVNWKTNRGIPRSGTFIPGQKALMAIVEDGAIVKYDSSLNTGLAVGMSPKWFTQHPGATLTSMMDYIKQYGAGENFTVDGMPGSFGVSQPGWSVRGTYDARSQTLYGVNSNGLSVALKGGSWTTDGLDEEWFKAHPGADLKLMRDAYPYYVTRLYSFKVKGMPLPSATQYCGRPVTLSGTFRREQRTGTLFDVVTGVDTNGAVWRWDSAYADKPVVTGFTDDFFQSPEGKGVNSLDALGQLCNRYSNINVLDIGNRKDLDFDFEGITIANKRYDGRYYRKGFAQRAILMDQDGNSYTADGNSGTFGAIVPTGIKPIG